MATVLSANVKSVGGVRRRQFRLSAQSPERRGHILSIPKHSGQQRPNESTPDSQTAKFSGKSGEFWPRRDCQVSLHFARDHSVDVNALVCRETLLGTLKTPPVDVMTEFEAAQPSCVNISLGYSVDPLARAIIGPYIALADNTNLETRVPLDRYLLEHGADPNSHVCGFLKPGLHLYTAI